MTDIRWGRGGAPRCATPVKEHATRLSAFGGLEIDAVNLVPSAAQLYRHRSFPFDTALYPLNIFLAFTTMSR